MTRLGRCMQRRTRRGENMKALCWHGKSDVRVDTVPDPKIEDPRRHCADHFHMHLRLRPASLQRIHADDGGWRCAWPRANGGGRGGGQVSHEARAGRARGGALHHLLRHLLVLRASGSLFALRQLEPQCRGRPQGDGPVAAALLGFSHMLGGSPADRPSTSEFPSPTLAPSRSPTAFPTRRWCFSPTSLAGLDRLPARIPASS